MFEQIQLGEKPKFDVHVYSAYANAVANDELVAQAWDGRNLSEDGINDSHHTRNEYHVVYKNQAGEYNIYSFAHIGYVPAIPVPAEKLERAHAAEPESIHLEHFGWSYGKQPLEKAVEWWNEHIIPPLASRTVPQLVS